MKKSSSEKSITFEGTLSAGGIPKSRPSKLVINPNQLSFSNFFINYELKPEQVISIEQHPQGGILVKNIVAEYSPSIHFATNGNVNLGDEIRKKGFIPLASENNNEIREGLPINFNRVIPVTIAVVFLSNFLASILFHYNVNSLLNSPFTMIGLCAYASIIRFIPLTSKLIVKPQRNIGEIFPFINLLILTSAIGAIYTFLVLFWENKSSIL